MNGTGCTMNYEQILRDFSIDVPEYINFGFDIIDAWAKKDRDKLALIWVSQKGERKKYSFLTKRIFQTRLQMSF